MRRRSILVTAFAIVLIAIAALALYWVWAADQVSAAIARWTEEQRARGYEIAYQGPAIGGFPAKLTVQFTEPRVSAPQGWRWSGAAIGGEAAFWQPWTLRLDLPLQQDLSLDWRGQRREFSLRAEAARGLIHLGREGWLKAATVEMENLALGDREGGTQGDDTLRADSLRYDLTRHPPTLEGVDDWTLLVSGETRGVVLPMGTPSPFGEKVEGIVFAATLNGMIPKGEPAEALARWRDSGGRLEVHELLLAWGPIELAADGAVTLDDRLRPQGAFAARIHGLPGALDALAARGLIEPSVALTLKFTALTLANQRDETGKAVVELPVTLRDGLFYLGPLALFPLAPVL